MYRREIKEWFLVLRHLLVYSTSISLTSIKICSHTYLSKEGISEGLARFIIGKLEGNKGHFTEIAVYMRCFQFCAAGGLRKGRGAQEHFSLVERFQS